MSPSLIHSLKTGKHCHKSFKVSSPDNPSTTNVTVKCLYIRNYNKNQHTTKNKRHSKQLFSSFISTCLRHSTVETNRQVSRILQETKQQNSNTLLFSEDTNVSLHHSSFRSSKTASPLISSNTSYCFAPSTYAFVFQRNTNLFPSNPGEHYSFIQSFLTLSRAFGCHVTSLAECLAKRHLFAYRIYHIPCKVPPICLQDVM